MLAQTRPTPAHLTSVQAEQILAQACENESHNAKRMRLGLEPVSQPLPLLPSTTVSTETHWLQYELNMYYKNKQLYNLHMCTTVRLDVSEQNVWKAKDKSEALSGTKAWSCVHSQRQNKVKVSGQFHFLVVYCGWSSSWYLWARSLFGCHCGFSMGTEKFLTLQESMHGIPAHNQPFCWMN